tara:strand:- start:354 stop:1175 length:822 start_codon:yes stop_codon:yes gene_type:complete
MITKTTTAVILFGLIAVIGFGNAYAETPDRVTVDSFPFEITIEEGGELTLINNDHVGHGLYHQFGNEKFNETVPRGDELVITLPEFMTEANNPDGYAMYDRLNDQYSMIFVKAPYVAPPVYIPPPQPVYVEPVYVEPVVEPTPVVIAEPLEEVNFNATSSATLGTYESISNVATFDGDVDAKALQKSLADVTADFNKSVERIAEQKAEIELLNANALTAVDTTELDTLQANNTALANEVRTITADRDEWKSLAENWYGVAMAQIKVMVNILGL